MIAMTLEEIRRLAENREHQDREAPYRDALLGCGAVESLANMPRWMRWEIESLDAQLQEREARFR